MFWNITLSFPVSKHIESATQHESIDESVQYEQCQNEHIHQECKSLEVRQVFGLTQFESVWLQFTLFPPCLSTIRGHFHPPLDRPRPQDVFKGKRNSPVTLQPSDHHGRKIGLRRILSASCDTPRPGPCALLACCLALTSLTSLVPSGFFG